MQQVPAEALRRRLHLPGRVRGLLLRRLRGVQAARRPRRRHRASSRARRSARSTPSRSRCCKEKNYFFRMSEFQQQLLDLYEEQPDFVQPESVRNEVVQFVKQGLDDLSISRSTFDWGIKVPWDAVARHLRLVRRAAELHHRGRLRRRTTSSSPAAGPPTTLVGKDIARFHAVIWPAMLMAAGLEVPHGGVRRTAGCSSAARRCRSRSSPASRRPRSPTCSVGRVPLLLPARDRVRPGRLVLLGGPVRPLPGRARQRFRQPGLAGDRHGRAATSTASLPAPGAYTDADLAIQRRSRDAAARRRRGDRALRASTRRSPRSGRIVDELNGYITEQEPWALAKDDATSASGSARCCTRRPRGCGALAVLLSPVMPDATEKLWDRARRERRSARSRPADPRGRRVGQLARGRPSPAARGAVPAHRAVEAMA